MSDRFIRLGPAVVLIMLTGSAYPQSPSFAGPTSGFVFGRVSRTIQPLLGVPGSTYLGPSVLKEVDYASVAPGGAWAFIAKSRRSSFVRGLADPSATPVSVDGLIGAVDHVAWSRDGSFGLLYSSSGNLLQRVQLSTSSATADPPVDLSPWGHADTLAIDPTGQSISFGVSGSGLFLFRAGQSPVQISAVSQPVAIAFDDTGLRLYAADLDRQQILEFDSGAGPVVFASLAQPDGSVFHPVGLGVSAGGRYLVLADSAGQAVRVYEIASQTLTNSIPLDFAPTRLEALSSRPTFVLNGDNRQEWLMILDAQQTPVVYFAPAAREAR